MARVVAVLLGLDDLPGATLTRYCASSLQTTRMAFHAIKAGEGDVFISAGVETVSRYVEGQLRRAGPTPRTRASPTRRPAPRKAAEGGAGLARPARGRHAARHLHRHGPDRREPGPAARASPARSMDEFGVRSQNLAEKAIADGFWAREITPVTLPDGTVVSTDDGPRAGVTFEAVAELKPVFRPDGRSPPATAARSTTAPPRVVVMSDTKARGARHHPAGPDRLHRRHRALARDHGPRPGRGVPAQALASGRHDHRRRRPGRDQRGVRRPGHPVLPGPRASTSTSST